jgi:glycerol-3-phosphate acyltransferase PlsX
MIRQDEKPSSALRRGTRSSMRLAINAVADGNAAAVVSAGNTGALMAISKFVFRTLPGVDRPAITAVMPSKTGPMVMLDMGANLECSSENLYQFAVMGDAFYRAAFSPDSSPRIGILNIGTEAGKGHAYLQEAADKIAASALNDCFDGFVEGTELMAGKVQVIVTDGFTGNVALKVAEGVARFIGHEGKRAIKSSIFGMIGGLFLMGGLRNLKKKFDPSRYNGGMLVGLNGISVKSHGSATAEGFANAIHVAASLARHRINDHIIARINAHHEPAPAPVGEEA